MAWMSYLPDSPERLSTIEAWLYFVIFIFGILAALSGYVVVQVRGYRANLEKKDVEKQLAKTEHDLSVTRTELDEARKNADAARKDAEQIQERFTQRDVPSEKREAILTILRRGKGKVIIMYPVDVEAQVFAKRLAVVIREAGWEATEEGAPSFGPIVGLSVKVHDEESAPTYTGLLKEALSAAFENVLFRTDTNVQKGNLHVIVGSKPPR